MQWKFSLKNIYLIKPIQSDAFKNIPSVCIASANLSVVFLKVSFYRLETWIRISSINTKYFRYETPSTDTRGAFHRYFLANFINKFIRDAYTAVPKLAPLKLRKIT